MNTIEHNTQWWPEDEQVVCSCLWITFAADPLDAEAAADRHIAEIAAEAAVAKVKAASKVVNP